MSTQPSTDETVATLDDVRLSFGALTVLDDVSVEVPAAAVTAVIGPNGSGKTTLARVVTGLLDHDGGTRELPTAGPRPVGYLPQDPQFRPRFTVEEVLAFYADLLPPNGTDVDEALSRAGIDVVRDRRIDQLSGGMRRLLGLATSLLGDPRLVVLDEPLTGLDPRMRDHVLSAIRDLADDGCGVFWTTHDLDAAARADRVVLLDAGRVLLSERPDRLLEQTGTDSLTEAFLSTVPDTTTVQSGAGGDR